MDEKAEAKVDNRYPLLMVTRVPDGRLNVLLRPAPGGLELPYVEFATKQFPHAVTNALRDQVKAQLGRDAVMLTCLAYESRPDRKSHEAFMALHDVSTEPPGAEWVQQAGLDGVAFASSAHEAAARDWLAQDESPHPLRTPWTVPGWLAEVSEWVGGELARLGKKPSGPIEQVRSWSISSLLRIPSDSGDYYFKAVPPLFAREPVLTQMLAQRYAGQVPEVAALDAERHWLLLRGFVGVPLHSSKDPAVWEEAIRRYARVQIDSLSALDELRAAGCADRGLDQLAGEIDVMLADEESLMIDLPRGLTRAELEALRQLAPALRAACAELAGCGIPHTLEHGDFHAGNIAVTNQGFIYYDWTDGCIAHPLVCLTTYLEGVEPDWHAQIKGAYLAEWARFGAPEQLNRALALSDALGPLQLAVSYRDIRATTEPRLRWELGSALPFFLKEVLKNQAVLTPA